MGLRYDAGHDPRRLTHGGPVIYPVDTGSRALTDLTFCWWRQLARAGGPRRFDAAGVERNASGQPDRHNDVMPYPEMPSGALALLILRVLRSGGLHGYAIARRIQMLSSDVLRSRKGRSIRRCSGCCSKGGSSTEWGISETNRKVRFYHLTAGRTPGARRARCRGTSASTRPSARSSAPRKAHGHA